MDFSTLVDCVAKEVGRPFETDRLAKVVNSAIRYVERSTDTPLIRHEVCLPCERLNDAVTWHITDIRQFDRIVYAEDMDGTPATETMPSATMAQHRSSGLPYWYRSGAHVIFGNIRQGVRMTWACHSPWFKYFKAGDRPTFWNDCGEWEGDTSDAGMARVTSLSLTAMFELIEERAVQAFFNRIDDPAADNADREAARLWNNITASGT